MWNWSCIVKVYCRATGIIMQQGGGILVAIATFLVYFYASATKCRRRHYVFGLSVRPSFRPSVRPSVRPSGRNRFCGRRNLRTVWGIQMKLGICMYEWTKLRWLTFGHTRSRVKGQRSRSNAKISLFPPYLCNALRYFHETWYIHVLPDEDSVGKVLGMGSKVKGQRSHENAQISLSFSISRKWLNVFSWNSVHRCNTTWRFSQ